MSIRFMYGYSVIKGKMQIDQIQAAVVRDIFSWYIGGLGITAIAKKLREEAVPTMLGGRWNVNSVDNILKNEKYTGNALLQKKFVADHLTKKEVLNTGQLPKYYAEGTHQAIINVETYEKAQAIREKRRERFQGRIRPQHYSFTKKILCNNCGHCYKRRTVGGKINWQCSTYLREGKSYCQAKQIPERTLFEVTTTVLGLQEFDADIFDRQIAKIRVPEANRLVYIFRDGREIEKTWQDHSRRESWTEEMKQKARKTALQQNARRDKQ